MLKIGLNRNSVNTRLRLRSDRCSIMTDGEACSAPCSSGGPSGALTKYLCQEMKEVLHQLRAISTPGSEDMQQPLVQMLIESWRSQSDIILSDLQCVHQLRELKVQ